MGRIGKSGAPHTKHRGIIENPERTGNLIGAICETWSAAMRDNLESWAHLSTESQSPTRNGSYFSKAYQRNGKTQTTLQVEHPNCPIYQIKGN